MSSAWFSARSATFYCTEFVNLFCTNKYATFAEPCRTLSCANTKNSRQLYARTLRNTSHRAIDGKEGWIAICGADKNNVFDPPALN